MFNTVENLERTRNILARSEQGREGPVGPVRAGDHVPGLFQVFGSVKDNTFKMAPFFTFYCLIRTKCPRMGRFK